MSPQVRPLRSPSEEFKQQTRLAEEYVHSVSSAELPWKTRVFIENKSSEVYAALCTIDGFRQLDLHSSLEEQVSSVVEMFDRVPDLGQRVFDALQDVIYRSSFSSYSPFSTSSESGLDILPLDRALSHFDRDFKRGPVGGSDAVGGIDDDVEFHTGGRPENAVGCSESEALIIEGYRDHIAAYIVERCGDYRGKYGINYAEQIRDIMKNAGYHFYYTCASEDVEATCDGAFAFFRRRYGERADWQVPEDVPNSCRSSTMYPRYPHIFFCDNYFTSLVSEGHAQIQESIIIHELVHFCDWRYDCEAGLFEYAHDAETTRVTEYNAAYIQAKWLGMYNCEARAFAKAYQREYGKSFIAKLVAFLGYWFIECPLLGILAFIALVAAVIALVTQQYWAIAGLAAIVGWQLARAIYIFSIE